jgi:hypothetical protein
VIAVVRVSATVQTGSGAIEFANGPIKTRYRLATLAIRNLLRGQVDVAQFAVPYTLLYNDAGWAGGVPRGYTIHDSLDPSAVRMVFLKRVGEGYKFTDGSYLSLICSPETPSGTEPSEIETKVIWWVGGTLRSSDVDRQERAQAIWQLGAAKADSAVAALRDFVHSDIARQNESLRMEALAALLRDKDTSMADLARRDLLNATESSATENLAFAVSSGLPPSRSIPILTEVLKNPSPEVRTAAARAI